MQIFEKEGRIHLQLMDLNTKRMLISCSVEKEAFPELRKHMIEHLNAFEVE